MRKLLITGFDPFGGETTNPSWEAVRKLPNSVGDFMLCKLEIPTIYGLAAEKVLETAKNMPFPGIFPGFTPSFRACNS
jgi:pyrrolidone-carboxylate peptidase